MRLHQQPKQSQPLNLAASVLGQAHLLVGNRNLCLQPQVYLGVAIVVEAVGLLLLLDRIIMSVQKASLRWPLVLNLLVLLVHLQQQQPSMALGLQAEAAWQVDLEPQANLLHLLHHRLSPLDPLSNLVLLRQAQHLSLDHLLPLLLLGGCSRALDQVHPRLRLQEDLLLERRHLRPKPRLSLPLVALALQCQRLGASLQREASLWG